MSAVLKSVLVALAVAGAPIGYVAYVSFLSPDDWVYGGGSPSNWTDAGYHAAPGPTAGAGLPVLAVGAGIYWLVRRRRKAR
jgi:MYXO-CTERM domain-containing protein